MRVSEEGRDFLRSSCYIREKREREKKVTVTQMKRGGWINGERMERKERGQNWTHPKKKYKEVDYKWLLPEYISLFSLAIHLSNEYNIT